MHCNYMMQKDARNIDLDFEKFWQHAVYYQYDAWTIFFF